jgi:heme A synthase
MLSVVAFRRLAFVTAFFAYLQIALGGVVRVTGSGLGCPDWPLCHGRPYPPANINSIIEYSHRLVGSITELLIVVTVVLAWVVFRARRPAVAWLATASLAAGLGEAVLGGVVVFNELSSWLVLVHLGLAMIILGCLIATAVLSMPEAPGIESASFRRLASAAVAGTYILLLSGSSVVATRSDESCRSWPLCDLSSVNTFSLLHRGVALVVGLLIIVFVVAAYRRGLRLSAAATAIVLLLQVGIGAASAITGAAAANGLHVAIATLVWSGVLVTALLALPRADRASARALLQIQKTPV